MGDDPILNMRGRAKQCRRLAKEIADRETVAILTRMADDIEADIQRLERERSRAAE